MYPVRQQQRTPPRPGTITTVQVIMTIKAGLLFSSLAYLGLGVVLSLTTAGSGDRDIEFMVTLILVIVLLTPVASLYLTVAIRVARGRNWARITAIVLESLSLAQSPFTISMRLDTYYTVLLVIGIALSIAVIGCATHRTAFMYCRGR